MTWSRPRERGWWTVGVLALGLTWGVVRGEATEQSVELVRDGQARCVVVLADDADRVARTAAEELTLHLKLVSGAEVAVTTQSAVPEGVYPIHIGASEVTQKMGIRPRELPLEGWRIEVTPQAMAIVGRDHRSDPFAGYGQPATLYGVSYWLERELGIDWFWPGDDGIYYQPRATITAKVGSVTAAPPMPLRHLRSSFTDYRALLTSPHVANKIWPAVKYDCPRMMAEYRLWERRVRLGRAGRMQAGHAMEWVYEAFHETHPEYFAMQMDGTRRVPGQPKHVKLCVSNPAIAQILIERGREELRRPDVLTYNIGFNDSDGWCFCEKCKALDPPIKPGMEMKTYPTFLKEGPEEIEYPFLTDRYLWMWNQVAQALHAEFPDKYVGVLLYGACKAPPQFRQFHPSIIIAATRINILRGAIDVDAMVADFDPWFQAGLRSFYWRPNLFWGDHNGVPYGMARPLGAVLKKLVALGMKGFDQDAWNGHFGSDGLNMYIVTQLARNPDQEIEQLIERYCHQAFGAAGPTIQRYYDLADQVRTRMDPKCMREAFYDRGHLYFTPEVMAQMDALAGQAQTLSQSDQEQFRRRVAVFLQAHQHTMLTMRSIEALHASRQDAQAYYRDLYEAVSAREKHIESVDSSWALNTAHLRYLTISRQVNNSGYDLYAKAATAALPAGTPRWRVGLGEGRLTAAPAAATIAVDGDLSDWPAATTGHTLLENYSNQAALAATTVMLARDDRALYVGFRCAEPESVYAVQREHDEALIANNDNVEILLAPEDFQQRYYHFMADVLGARYEARCRPGQFDADWNGAWEVAVKRSASDAGWTIEVAIPWSTLEQAGAPVGQTWTMNLYRTRRGPRFDEYQALSPTMGGFHDPKYFAAITFAAPSAGKGN